MNSPNRKNKIKTCIIMLMPFPIWLYFYHFVWRSGEWIFGQHVHKFEKQSTIIMTEALEAQ